MPDSDSVISVVATDKKLCKPFLVDVMVFSPESGYKFAVQVERACTPEADPIWKLVFDLYKVTDEEVQIVHVSYKAQSPVEAKGIQRMAAGVTPKQADLLVKDVHPAARDIEGVQAPTKKQKDRLRKAMSQAVSVNL
ncbi:MAG TPA: hypothetical protein VGP15_22985 [Burkholderiales bacterium]|jgi:hypothetical protein|nr:hypothetical protein [Burkholderiales bacterium]